MKTSKSLKNLPKTIIAIKGSNAHNNKNELSFYLKFEFINIIFIFLLNL